MNHTSMAAMAGPQTITDGIYPSFFIKAVQNDFQSNAQGRPIFDDKEYVKIVIAGDKNTSVERKVTDDDRERWPYLYARFKQGLEQAEEGTPLEQWALLTPSQVAEFKALNIPTVEAMAAVSDTQLKNLGPGARPIRERAKIFLSQAAGSKPALKLQSDVEQLREQMAVMQKTIEDQAAELQRRAPVKEAAE
jgi:hypothetical protein